MIAFVVKGGRVEGMGHVFRCLCLAEKIGEDARFYFLNGDDVAMGIVEERGFEAVKGFKPRGEKLVIFDVFNVERGYAEMARSCGSVVMLDSLTSVDFADAVINAMIRCPKGGVFCGPKYLILRDEFFDYWRRRKVIRDEVRRVLLMFGGSDPSNYTVKVMRLLESYDVLAVLGPGYRWVDEAIRVADETGAEVVMSPRRVAGLMYKSDVVVTSLGLTFFESMCVGTPAIAICQNDVQRWIYDNTYRFGLVLRSFDPSSFISAFKTVLDKNVRLNLSVRGKDLCDGLGVYRVLNVLEVVGCRR